MTARPAQIGAGPAGDSPLTVAAVLKETARRLAGAGVPEPRRDARLLIGHALGGGAEIALGFPERILSPEEAERVAVCVSQRARRRPVSRIVGRREFWSLPFEVTEETLDPRPDSECLVEAVLALLPERRAPLRILDLGTGTGCLLLALLHELPQARGFGVDISPGACEAAARNALSLGLDRRAAFAVGDWGAGLAGAYDVIVANPPYIRAAELAGLDPEVRDFEPRRALDGGSDGLAAYRALAPDVARLLAPEGFAAFEIGLGQAEAVASILRAQGLAPLAVARDLQSHERCLITGRIP